MLATVKILFLAANPAETTRLALDEEIHEIQDRLRRSGASARFEIVSEWAVRAVELPAALMRHKPHIVHFCGHGTPEGELLVAASESFAKVPADTLRRLFEALPGETICVFLNACFSHHQAAAVATVVPCAIGMTQAVIDRVATAFSAAFYEALAFGEGIQTAFNIGVLGPELDQLHGHREVPKLFLRPDVDSSRQHLPGLPGAQLNFLAARLDKGSTTQLERQQALARCNDISLSGGTAITLPDIASTSEIEHQADRNGARVFNEVTLRLRFATYEQTRNGVVTETQIGDGSCVFDGASIDAAVIIGDIRELISATTDLSIRIIDERESFFSRLISDIEQQNEISKEQRLTRFGLIMRIEEIRKYHLLLIQGIRLIAADKSGWMEDLKWAGSSLIGFANYHHMLNSKARSGLDEVISFDVFRSDLRLNGRFHLDELEAKNIAIKLVGAPDATYLAGGWCDLADFPPEVRYGRVIPAIIWEVLYASKRNDLDKAEALNFFRWRIGLA